MHNYDNKYTLINFCITLMLAGRAERTWDAAVSLLERVGENLIISSLQNGKKDVQTRWF